MENALPVPLGMTTVDGEPLGATASTLGPIVNIGDLSIVTRETIAPADPFALWVLDTASEIVRSAASQPTWDALTSPPRARQICVHLAARSYTNPDSVTRETVGPLGESRVEALATALHLTETERQELASLAPAAAKQRASGGLYVQPLGGTTQVTTLQVGDPIYLLDSSGTPFPVYAAGDVGSPE